MHLAHIGTVVLAAFLASLVEFWFAQALNAEKCLLAVANHNPRVQTHPLKDTGRQLFAAGNVADDIDLYPGLAAYFQRADHGFVSDVDVIDQQLAFCAFDESLKPFARVDGAYDKLIAMRSVGLALGVSSKKS